MQIVIDIDEETYDYWKEHSYEYVFAQAIKEGVILPKGHGELKDAGVMINKLCTHEASEFFGSVICAEIMDFINNEKPIIEADKE